MQRGPSLGGGTHQHPRRSESIRHETDAPTRSQHGRSDPLVLRRQRSDLAESIRSASQMPRWNAPRAFSTSLTPLCVPILCSARRSWRPRAHLQRRCSDQIAIAPVAPACPNPATSCLGASPTPPVGVCVAAVRVAASEKPAQQLPEMLHLRELQSRANNRPEQLQQRVRTEPISIFSACFRAGHFTEPRAHESLEAVCRRCQLGVSNAKH